MPSTGISSPLMCLTAERPSQTLKGRNVETRPRLPKPLATRKEFIEKKPSEAPLRQPKKKRQQSWTKCCAKTWGNREREFDAPAPQRGWVGEDEEQGLKAKSKKSSTMGGKLGYQAALGSPTGTMPASPRGSRSRSAVRTIWTLAIVSII